MQNFRNWLEELGLADQDFVSKPLRIKNKILPDKTKIPAIPTKTWERGVGMARKVEGKTPSLASKEIKDLAIWNFANHVDSTNQMPKARIFGDKVKIVDMRDIPKYTFDTDKKN